MNGNGNRILDFVLDVTMSIMQSDDDPIDCIPNGIELPESDESNPPPSFVFVDMSSNHSPGSTGLEEEDLARDVTRDTAGAVAPSSFALRRFPCSYVVAILLPLN